MNGLGYEPHGSGSCLVGTVSVGIDLVGTISGSNNCLELFSADSIQNPRGFNTKAPHHSERSESLQVGRGYPNRCSKRFSQHKPRYREVSPRIGIAAMSQYFGGVYTQLR